MAGGAYVALSGLRARSEHLDRLAADIANGSTSGPIHFGGGRPGFFGSGSQANITDLPGSGGYVMLHLMR